MRIRDDHLNHGAALIQIAEHPQFTAINSLKVKNVKFENAYKINDNIAIYLKYSTAPNKNYGEYIFTFTKAHLDELDVINKAHQKSFLALVCVKAREVCCLSYNQLDELIKRRRADFGHAENQYTLLVTAQPGKSLHVYISAPGTKKTKLGKGYRGGPQCISSFSV